MPVSDPGLPGAFGCTGKTNTEYVEWRAQHEENVRRRAAEAEQAAIDKQRSRDRRDSAIGEMLSHFDLTMDDLRDFIREAATGEW